MRTKATFLAGFATGYVLGSRAGRARYEQIRQATRSFLSNPAVQSTASTLQHQAEDVLTTAKDKAASTLGDKLGEKKPAWLGSAGTTGHPTTGHPTNGSSVTTNGHRA